MGKRFGRRRLRGRHCIDPSRGRDSGGSGGIAVMVTSWDADSGWGTANADVHIPHAKIDSPLLDSSEPSVQVKKAEITLTFCILISVSNKWQFSVEKEEHGWLLAIIEAILVTYTSKSGESA